MTAREVKLEAGKDEVTEMGTQTDEQGQDGKPESEGTTAMKEEETDIEVGMMVRSMAREHGEQGSTTREARNTEHALRRIRKRVLRRKKKRAL